MDPATIATLLALASQLVAIVAKAIQDRNADSAAIKSDLAAALADLQVKVAALAPALATNDAKIDAALAAK